MSEWPQKFLHAFEEGNPYDSISAAQEDLTLDDAYDIQCRYVSLRGEPISGYKAAMTANQAQQAMGIDKPIIGALFAAGAHPQGKPVALTRPILLETELAFRVNQPVTTPVTADSAFQCVDACLPMIELAAPNLATQPNALDLVATNSASHGYIAGTEADMGTIDFDTLSVRLLADNAEQWCGTGASVLGGQREALAFLINEVLARGYSVEAGHLMMTGSIGGILPGRAGQFIGDFGPLGEIRFALQEAQ